MIPNDKPKDVLSEEQKKFINDNFEKLELNELSKQTWNDPKADMRSLRGKAVKDYLVSNNMQMIRVVRKPTGGPIVLTQEQKEFIESSYENNIKPLEITRLVFQNHNLAPLSREFRAIAAYIKSLSPEDFDKNEEVVDAKDYRPPQSMNHLIGRVNEYMPTGSSDTTLYNIQSLKTFEEKCLKQLMGYVRSPTFCYQATQYEKKVDRDLFESNFMRFCHDKPDLTAEEIHQYIGLCSEIVNTAQIERTIQKLDSNINEWLAGDDNEKKKMSMSMVELINAARGKWEASKERQKKLLAELTESRSIRLKNRLDQNASILNLVEAFQKEQTRKELLEIAEMEKKADIEETNKLANMDQVVALIAGMSIKDLSR